MNAVLFVVLWAVLSLLSTLAGARLFPRVPRPLLGAAACVGSALVIYGLLVGTFAVQRF